MAIHRTKRQGERQGMHNQPALEMHLTSCKAGLWSKRAADVVLMQNCCLPMQRMSGKLPCRCHGRPEMRHISISQVQVFMHQLATSMWAAPLIQSVQDGR